MIANPLKVNSYVLLIVCQLVYTLPNLIKNIHICVNVRETDRNRQRQRQKDPMEYELQVAMSLLPPKLHVASGN